MKLDIQVDIQFLNGLANVEGYQSLRRPLPPPPCPLRSEE